MKTLSAPPTTSRWVFHAVISLRGFIKNTPGVVMYSSPVASLWSFGIFGFPISVADFFEGRCKISPDSSSDFLAFSWMLHRTVFGQTFHKGKVKNINPGMENLVPDSWVYSRRLFWRSVDVNISPMILGFTFGVYEEGILRFIPYWWDSPRSRHLCTGDDKISPVSDFKNISHIF